MTKHVKLFTFSLGRLFAHTHTHQTGWNKEKKNNPKYLQVQILICGNRHTKKGNMDILWNVTTHF